MLSGRAGPVTGRAAASQCTVWEIPHRKSETGHGTEKPVECMRRPIENNSSPGQAVYEPFWGGDDDYRCRDDRAVLSRHRTEPGLRRCGGEALAGICGGGGSLEVTGGSLTVTGERGVASAAATERGEHVSRAVLVRGGAPWP